MALTSWNNILNKPNALENVDELEVSVAALSASVLGVKGEVENLVTEVTGITHSQSITVDKLDCFKIKDIIFFSAKITVINDILGSQPLFENLPDIGQYNENWAIVNPAHNATNTSTFSARFFETRLYTNLTGQFTAGASYYISAQYIASSSNRSEEPTETKKKTTKKK